MASALVPAPDYPNYAGFLSNLIGNLPTQDRNAQLQQGQIDVQNAFKGGVPMNADGTPNYAAALQRLATAGDPGAVAALGPLAQGQQQLTQAQQPSGLWPSGAPATAPAAPMQLPSAAPAAPVAPQGNLPPASAAGGRPTTAPATQPTVTGTVSDGLPSLSEVVAGAVPDPTKRQNATALLSKAIGVDPNAPLSPDQMSRAQRIIAANKMGGPNMGAGQLADAVRGQLIDSGQASSASAPPAPPLRLPDTATVGRTTAQVHADGAAGNADIAARGGLGGRNLTQAEAVAIATGKADGGATANDPIAALKKNISGIESGGNYGIVGPVTSTGDRAYGKYQVMGANIGPWTQEVFGRAMTPEQFLKNPGAQERVADFQMRKLAAQGYAPQDIASIWFTGKPLAQGANSRDQLGTSGAQYATEATKGIGGGGPAQGGRPIVPQVPLPPGITDPQQAILAIDREIAKYSGNPSARGQVEALMDWRDRIANSTAPIQVGSTTTIVDPRTGSPTFQGPFASGQGMLTPEAIDGAAENWIKSGDLPKNMGRGIQGAQATNAIMNRAYQIMEERGIDPSGLSETWQAFKSRSSGERALETRAANLSLVENEAKRLIPRVRDIIKTMNPTNYPTLNEAINAYAKQTGDPNIIKLGISAESLARVYARVLKPTGTVAVSDVQAAHEILDKNWSAGQIGAALDQMELEIESAHQSLQDTRQDYSGQKRETPANSPAAPLPRSAAATGSTPVGGAPPPGKYTWDPSTGQLAPAK